MTGWADIIEKRGKKPASGSDRIICSLMKTFFTTVMVYKVQCTQRDQDHGSVDKSNTDTSRSLLKPVVTVTATDRLTALTKKKKNYKNKQTNKQTKQKKRQKCTHKKPKENKPQKCTSTSSLLRLL